jgi:hypothetical protein
MFAAGAELAGMEAPLSDDPYPTGNNGGGRSAANNSSSDIALGAYNSSRDFVMHVSGYAFELPIVGVRIHVRGWRRVRGHGSAVIG